MARNSVKRPKGVELLAFLKPQAVARGLHHHENALAAMDANEHESGFSEF
jgi:hypothetical protein